MKFVVPLQPPRAKRAWSLWDAVDFGPACPQPIQYVGATKGIRYMNEDCLYLNIFAPTVKAICGRIVCLGRQRSVAGIHAPAGSRSKSFPKLFAPLKLRVCSINSFWCKTALFGCFFFNLIYLF